MSHSARAINSSRVLCHILHQLASSTTGGFASAIMRRSALRPSAIPRSSTPVLIAALPSPGHRPPLGLCRVPRRDPRPQARASCGTQRVDCRRLRSKRRGCRGVRRRSCRASKTLVSEISGQAYTPYLIRGPDRRGYTSPDTSRYPTYDKGSVWFATPLL
jgi:hypothetical protein